MNAKKIALGLVVHNDRIGVSRETGVMSNYAYRMRLGSGKLALGLGLGLKMMQADWTAVRTVTPGDVEFATDSRGVLEPKFSAGAYYSNSRWFAGLSLPYFLGQSRDIGNDRWEMTKIASVSAHAHGGLSTGRGPRYQIEAFGADGKRVVKRPRPTSTST